jgi:hypothetical protein
MLAPAGGASLCPGTGGVPVATGLSVPERQNNTTSYVSVRNVTTRIPPYPPASCLSSGC